MSKIIVADTAPLIALAWVDLLPALPMMFSKVYVPRGVLAEALEDASRPGARAIKTALEEGWLTPRSVEVEAQFKVLIEVLDQGEAEALALASQLRAVALIDEKRGRKVARKHGIAVTGSAAVLLKARSSGLINEVRPLIEKLDLHGYRMSSELKAKVLERAGEL